MAFTSFLAVIVCLLYFTQFLTATIPKPNSSQTYIVHVEAHSNDLDALYDSFMQTAEMVAGDDQPRILHRYRDVLKGFAARLSEGQLESMKKMEGFVSARPEKVYRLLTTHSPNFIGLNQNAGLWKDSNYGKGVIIGMLDTGITPDHPSFSDKGMPPAPAKWKGKCEFSRGACNNKLIGARNMVSGGVSPADEEGHGTHTASTAGGNFVADASIFGNANGTADGIAPLAHVAVYRVCSPEGCGEGDILAGMDAAIHDGVDVLSLSLGGLYDEPFPYDSIALGAFRAIEKGIFVSCAGGNDGPDYHTMSNQAPWILTVGASTIDRKLTSAVVLGNGQELNGETAFQPRDFNSTTQFELLYPKGKNNPQFCREGDLSKSDAKGRIVVCELGGNVGREAKGVAVKNAGGAGMILLNSKTQGSTAFAEVHVLPASHINFADATKLKAYLNSTGSPKARLVFKGTSIGGDRGTPAVTYYSSRGPNNVSPGILKPDIIGPGNNIIAAWNMSPSNASTSKTKANYNMISGTSMSCPHLSGVAALLKSAHPDWSPSAIKSAIMTTADQVNLGGKPINDERDQPADIFATGAGHVNPSKATDPGLIYDIHPDDYIPYLCGLNYTSEEVTLIVKQIVICSSKSSIPEAELNYPSFTISFGSASQTYTRTVTNVGEPNSLYDVKIVAPAGVAVAVKPTRLQFSKVGEKLKYSVTFSRSGTGGGTNKIGQGLIKWISGKHSVTSPIAVMF